MHLHAMRHKAVRKITAQLISGLEHGCTLAGLAGQWCNHVFSGSGLWLSAQAGQSTNTIGNLACGFAQAG